MTKKILFYSITVLSLFSFQNALAFEPQAPSRYFNGPTVQAVTSTTAQVLLSQAELQGLTNEEKLNIYFEYRETHQMCIMIYPTPEYCLPKKTDLSKTNVTINNLKPNTSYTVTYKRDNTIRCITTPCPGNEFQSLPVEFITNAASGTTTPPENVQITKNLFFGSRGAQVTALQMILVKEGYMKVFPTGYFGVLTLQAVKQFQKAHGINPTGYVGPLTRAVLAKMTGYVSTSAVAEKFEGFITAYSNGCFVDGECSISVDNKKIVTTRGRSQEIVGVVTGISDFGAMENKVGAHARVYAKKMGDSYTLYGNVNYYIVIE